MKKVSWEKLDRAIYDLQNKVFDLFPQRDVEICVHTVLARQEPVQAKVSWPSLGTKTPEEAKTFMEHLAEAIKLAESFEFNGYVVGTAEEVEAEENLEELNDIVVDESNASMIEEKVQNIYLTNEDPWNTVDAFVGDYADEYDMIGAMEELCTNDIHGNIIFKSDVNADYIQNILDAHHIIDEMYCLTTLSGMGLYYGDSREDCTNAFISYMDEAHDTEAGIVDFEEMKEIIEAWEAPCTLTVICELACRPKVRLYYGKRL